MSTPTLVSAVLLLLLLVAGVAVARIHRKLKALPGKKKKKIFTRSVNKVFTWLEDKGLMRRTKAYLPDYHRHYKGLKELEDGYPDVRDECLRLLEIKDRLTDVKDLGAGYTKGGIHKAQWKAFMFKSGDFIEENCARAPKTAALLRNIPGLYTAFFSIVDPHQYITPHWGYYKGFLRYHLGVLIPDNNRERKCWLRVNDDPEDNRRQDESLIENGEKYYWKNGEGIVFDDNFLHDAKNESDQIRVVLWLDLRRRMPFYAQMFNLLFLWLVQKDASIAKIRRAATVEGPS
jgi:aspartyl/asparaginyl beta-hydroxylase (cupin superfamily)